MARTPKGTKGEAWGILNPYGDIWTTRTFETEQDARDHVAAFWSDLDGGTERDLRKFKPVRVNVHVTVATPKEAHDG
jgi:hypothetical protein